MKKDVVRSGCDLRVGGGGQLLQRNLIKYICKLKFLFNYFWMSVRFPQYSPLALLFHVWDLGEWRLLCCFDFLSRNRYSSVSMSSPSLVQRTQNVVIPRVVGQRQWHKHPKPQPIYTLRPVEMVDTRVQNCKCVCVCEKSNKKHVFIVRWLLGDVACRSNAIAISSNWFTVGRHFSSNTPWLHAPRRMRHPTNNLDFHQNLLVSILCWRSAK